MTYNPWPNGLVPKELQRPELDELRLRGYSFDDPRDVVGICERKIASYFGAKYCVTTDCCSHAIFLSLQYLKAIGKIYEGDDIILPKHTYISVPLQVLHSRLHVRFKDFAWRGMYYLAPTNIIDSAVMWINGSYVPSTLMCISLQIKKLIPTGKMGAVLTDDLTAYNYLKLASYDGRDLNTPYDSKNHVKMLGWHMYATPEDCARTIILMDEREGMTMYNSSDNYPDVSLMLKNI
jgi:hypothetical protein